MPVKIAILGDFNSDMPTLVAINTSIGQMQKVIGKEIQYDWFDTDTFDYRKSFAEGYAGLWISPGSPYKNMDNVLNSIRFVRENRIPAFGNCGGFQHMVLEFARNVCHIDSADHQETNPASADPVIVKLSCSLAGLSEVLKITIPDSLLYSLIGQPVLIARYFCSYGVNEKYLKVLQDNGLIFTAQSEEGYNRALEIADHPFYVGTLFQPALSTTPEQPDPLIEGFIRHMLKKSV